MRLVRQPVTQQQSRLVTQLRQQQNRLVVMRLKRRPVVQLRQQQNRLVMIMLRSSEGRP